MMYKKIVLAGGNGYLGQVLANYYSDKAEQIIILSRSPKPANNNITTVVWDGKNEGEWTNSLQNADMLVNLCGKNVNCRYNAANKAEIFASRLIPTALLGSVIAGMENPPALWINITSATIYRHAEDGPQDEANGEIGEGFSVEVCRQWEAVFNQQHTPRTRKVALRMGIVLGLADGVFPRLLNLVKYGLGGQQGNGRQYTAWVHELDVARCTEWLLQHPEQAGVFNCTAPVPAKNAEMMRVIRKAYGRHFGLPAPAWLLAIGTVLIGTEPELILKSRWVIPARLLKAGFSFKYELIEDAVHDLLK